MFDWQDAALAFSRAEFSAGSSIPARIAMIAMTTKSSINVNKCRRLENPDLSVRCKVLDRFHVVFICAPSFPGCRLAALRQTDFPRNPASQS